MQAALDAMHIMCIPLSLRNWTDMPRTGPVHTEEPLTLLGYTFQDPSLGRTAIVRIDLHGRPVPANFGRAD